MEKLTKLVHDVATGKIEIVELTDDECAELLEMRASQPVPPGTPDE